MCSASTTGAFRFTNAYGAAIRPPRRSETSSLDTIITVRNESIRPRHRLPDRHRGLARRAHRLRPSLDGHDGVLGFGRHAAGGGGPESVEGEGHRACGGSIDVLIAGTIRDVNVRWRLATMTPEVRPSTWRMMRPHLEGAGEPARRSDYGFLPHGMTARLARADWQLARRRGHRTIPVRNPYPACSIDERWPSLPARSGRMLIEKSMTVRLLVRRDQCHPPDGLSVCTNG